jgi:hypothetical protein
MDYTENIYPQINPYYICPQITQINPYYICPQITQITQINREYTWIPV